MRNMDCLNKVSFYVKKTTMKRSICWKRSGGPSSNPSLGSNFSLEIY
jgi:hypothetical protein